MIRIKKPKKAPGILLTKGVAQTKRDCADYDSCPDYKTGKKKFKFKVRSPYNAPPVKKALMKAFHGKCCYCEKRYEQLNLEVEHFRPKSEVKQTRNQKKADCPGYYWLVNDWDNLLLSCGVCNRTFKKTLFPLADPGSYPKEWR